jgi:beta-lactamase superfamily II metal-dependent hydrolase
MNKLELMVFNVGHGLSVALVERPENYVTLVDLGAGSGFTPLKFMSLKLNLRPDVLYITHPHADHLDDVETALDKSFRPLGLHYQVYDWADVKRREKQDLAYKVDRFLDLQRVVPYRRYRGRARMNCWRYTPSKALKYFGDATYVNNSSYFLIYKWRDFKIAIAGDLESDAMKSMIGSEAVREDARGAHILIPAHHGHKNGFPSDWAAKMGRPRVSIISVQSRDLSVDPRYESPDFAKGVKFQGMIRYALTTRLDGSILVTMWYDTNGNPVWMFKAF